MGSAEIVTPQWAACPREDTSQTWRVQVLAWNRVLHAAQGLLGPLWLPGVSASFIPLLSLAVPPGWGWASPEPLGRDARTPVSQSFCLALITAPYIITSRFTVSSATVELSPSVQKNLKEFEPQLMSTCHHPGGATHHSGKSVFLEPWIERCAPAFTEVRKLRKLVAHGQATFIFETGQLAVWPWLGVPGGALQGKGASSLPASHASLPLRMEGFTFPKGPRSRLDVGTSAPPLPLLTRLSVSLGLPTVTWPWSSHLSPSCSSWITACSPGLKLQPAPWWAW